MRNLQSTPSSSTNTTSQKKCDVFLNFRGEETRRCFTCHLHKELQEKIETFIDDEAPKGIRIWPTLKGAIERSKISVVIFSTDYASSKWCLRELVEIMERRNLHNQIVIPVFYGIEPTNVRNQTGSFKDSFDTYGNKSQEEVQKWRKALTEASNLFGFHSSNFKNDRTLIDQIVDHIWMRLKRECPPHDIEGLIGHEQIKQVISSLCLFDRTNVQIIGIWGMGGIGKSYIAGAIFDNISNQFEGGCFIEVRQSFQKSASLVSLHEDILSKVFNGENLKLNGPTIPLKIKDRLNRTKVLIVLDNVFNIDHHVPLENLVPGVDRLGLGSRVIITSRDKHVLLSCGVEKIFEVKELNHPDALQLFRNNAFKENYPLEDRTVLSNELVKYSNCNPLALSVLGSLLYRRSLQEWECVVKTLRTTNLNRSIFVALKLSYDGLEDSEKDIFLDIACFLKGKTRDYVEKIIGDCCMDLGALIDKSLITISSNSEIQMHDLLEEMGREIVEKESPNDPGKRSRLWKQEDVQNTLKYNKGTSAVQGIVLDLSNIKDMQLSPQAFEKMFNLRILNFYDSGFNLYFDRPYNSKVHIRDCLSDFPGKLRSLIWLGFPLKTLPSNFNPENLVELDLTDSNLERLWEGTTPTPNLKMLILGGCKHLTNIPDLSDAPLLERIELNRCQSLLDFPPVAPLNYLHYLNLRGCESLRSFSSDIHFKSLTSLELHGRANLTKFSKISGDLTRLDLSGTAIDVLPSIGSLTKLSDLILSKCTRLKHIPTDICKLKSLYYLNLANCSGLESFPEIPGNLGYLDLSGTAIDKVPSSIASLTNLSNLNLSRCMRLKHISNSLCKLKYLRFLNLENCSKLEIFPKIWETMEDLRSLELSGTEIKELPGSIEKLNGLIELNLRRCKNLKELPSSICNLTSLQCLDLSDCSKLEILPDNLGNLKSLSELSIDSTAISQLPSTMMHLNKLDLLSCRGYRGLRFTLSSVFLCSLSSLDLSDCNLEEIPEDICHLSKLVDLYLSGNNFESLPKSMKQLSNLERLKVNNCNRLQSLTELPLSLTLLSASDCEQLRSIPDTSEFVVKAEFRFINCPNLEETAVGNILATVKEYEGEIGSFSFCCPGSEVPGWFSNKSNESSIELQMSRHDCFNLGFIVCAVIEFKKYRFDANDKDGLFIWCKWKCSGYENQCTTTEGYTLIACSSFGTLIDSDHVALRCCTVPGSGFTDFSFEFRLSDKSPNCRVKSCGVRRITVPDEVSDEDN